MSNLELWRTDRSPFSLLRNWDSITKELDSFFSDFDKTVSDNRGRESGDMIVSPACDVQEDEKAYHLSFDLPGFKREDVNIEVAGNRISLSGKRSREASSKDAKYHRVERNY